MVKLKLLKGIAHNLADSFSSCTNTEFVHYVYAQPKKDMSFNVDILNETISPGSDNPSLKESVIKYKRWFLKNLQELKIPQDEVVSMLLKIDISNTRLSQNWIVKSTVKTKEGKEFSDELRTSCVY